METDKQKFLQEIMTLGAKLEKTEDRFEVVMIINEAEILYDNHVAQL